MVVCSVMETPLVPIHNMGQDDTVIGDVTDLWCA